MKQGINRIFWLQATEVDSGYLEMKKESLLKRYGARDCVHRIEGKVEKSSWKARPKKGSSWNRIWVSGKDLQMFLPVLLSWWMNDTHFQFYFQKRPKFQWSILQWLSLTRVAIGRQCTFTDSPTSDSNETVPKKCILGNSLVVQKLRLCASTAEGMASIPVWATKILHAMWHGQKKHLKQVLTIKY